jgi:chromosome segregation protein
LTIRATATGGAALNLDLDEVAVGRRLFRDGTSEYQINKQTARLKDVRELFLDTGVGVDAYSVIEQGRVAALLDANPQERRLIFEEAAGISKFKQRKKERSGSWSASIRICCASMMWWKKSSGAARR